MTPRQGIALLRSLLTAAATAAVMFACPQPASAETAVPSVAAQIAHAEFLPYMDPPPGPPATVCLVDTGVDLNPDTQPTVVDREALDGGDPGDVWDRKHGTEMAMVMGAPINDWGTVGAWPLVRIVSVRAMAPGATSFPFNAYAKAIQACLNIESIGVISLSFSGPRPTDAEIAHLDDYVTQAQANDVSVVAGAGNDGGAVGWPAADSSVFAVAAVGQARALCGFSARGPRVAVAAPGCDLELADPAIGSAIAYAGTSPAAAFTSAVLAALRSYRRDLTANGAEDLLRKSAAADILDVGAAFRLAGLGTEVTAASVRIPTPETGEPQTAPSSDPALLEPPLTAWPDISAEPRRQRWATPRLRSRTCTPRYLVVRVTKRPPGATLRVRAYAVGREFEGRELARWQRRTAVVRLRRGFDFATLQFAGEGAADSRMKRIAKCRGR